MSLRGLLLLLFISAGFSAQAQLLGLFQKHERFPLLEHARSAGYPSFPSAKLAITRLRPFNVPLSDYSLENAEQMIMKTAQHNMRFHVYDQASYNFSNLAQLYVQQNRFSEAKWYFLQSSLLSRQQNNLKLTYSNLCNLGLLKSEIGDFMLAQQDLLEALNIASSKGWLIEVIETEKKLAFIRQKRIASLRTDLRYADLATVD